MKSSEWKSSTTGDMKSVTIDIFSTAICLQNKNSLEIAIGCIFTRILTCKLWMHQSLNTVEYNCISEAGTKTSPYDVDRSKNIWHRVERRSVARESHSLPAPTPIGLQHMVLFIINTSCLTVRTRHAVI